MRQTEIAPIDIHVGKKLKKLRAEYNLSQQKIGTIVGVSYQQVQKYENGTCRLGPNAIIKIAGKLHIQPNYFFEGFNTPPTSKIHESSEAELAQMVALFSKIKNPVFRKSLLEMAYKYQTED